MIAFSDSYIQMMERRGEFIGYSTEYLNEAIQNAPGLYHFIINKTKVWRPIAMLKLEGETRAAIGIKIENIEAAVALIIEEYEPKELVLVMEAYGVISGDPNPQKALAIICAGQGRTEQRAARVNVDQSGIHTVDESSWCNSRGLWPDKTLDELHKLFTDTAKRKALCGGLNADEALVELRIGEGDEE